MRWDDGKGDAPMEFYKEYMFITGVPSYGLYPCLYSIVPTGLTSGRVGE